MDAGPVSPPRGAGKPPARMRLILNFVKSTNFTPEKTPLFTKFYRSRMSGKMICRSKTPENERQNDLSITNERQTIRVINRV